MKGLIVRSTTWDNETCQVGMPGEGVSIIINAMERDNHCHWSVGGYHPKEKKHWTWKGGTLHVGDKIEMTFAEFEEATPPVLKEPHTCPAPPEGDSPEMWQFKLETYQKIKEVLKEEGLI